MHILLAFLALTVAGSTSVGAQQGSWVGKTVILAKETVIAESAPVKQILTLFHSLEENSYEVLGEKNGKIQVRNPNGVFDWWFDKSDAVLLSNAKAYFTGRINMNPKDSFAYSQRAFAAVLKDRDGGRNDAIKDYGEAIKLNPKNDVALSARAILLAEKKEFAKAVADINDAVRLDPKCANYYYNRGVIFFAMKEPEKASLNYGEAIRLDPRNSKALHNRAVIWISEKNDFDDAIADLSEAIRVNPKEVEHYSARAACWGAKQEFDKVITDCDIIVRLRRDCLAAYRYRGAAFIRKKEYDKAISDFDEAIRLDPKNAVCYALRGEAWLEKKSFVKGMADYREFLRLVTPSAISVNKIAWLFATVPDDKARDGKYALELAKKAIELDPSGAASYLESLAAAHAELGQFDDAIRCQERAMLNPSIRSNTEAQQRLDLYRKKQAYRITP